MCQKAGAILAHHACRYEEHREAIAAQQENIIVPLVAHLASGKNGLVHNAALLLGQCLFANTEFRQAFGQDEAGPHALLKAMGDTDAGVLVNATWAVRHFFSDAKCDLSVELLDLAEASLSPLLAHSDARVQRHASKLSTLVQQRRDHLETTIAQREREQSKQAVVTLASARGDSIQDEKCTQAIAVLAALTTGMEVPANRDEGDSPTIREHPPPLCSTSPKKSMKKSPRRLSPWKKAMAFQFSAAAAKNRKFQAAVAG